MAAVHVQVGAAERGVLDADDGVGGRLRDRDWPGLDGDSVRTEKDDGVHWGYFYLVERYLMVYFVSDFD